MAAELPCPSCSFVNTARDRRCVRCGEILPDRDALDSLDGEQLALAEAAFQRRAQGAARFSAPELNALTTVARTVGHLAELGMGPTDIHEALRRRGLSQSAAEYFATRAGRELASGRLATIERRRLQIAVSGCAALLAAWALMADTSRVSAWGLLVATGAQLVMALRSGRPSREERASGPPRVLEGIAAKDAKSERPDGSPAQRPTAGSL